MSRELLRDALVVWRETRAEAIAEIVDRLTAQLSRGWEPPAPKLARTFHVAWLEAAADDVHRGWAARHVLDKLPDRSAAVRERLTALLAAGPDPRVSHELEQQLEKLRAFKELDEILARVIAELETRPVREPTEGELARFAPPVRTADLASLERDVYANPDDDEPRAVLADLLQARGDPRGELIALQLAVAAGRGSDEGDARIEELVRDHGRAWLGPLSDIAERAEMQRGFLSRLELAGDDRAGPARWESVVDHPLFGTVEELVAGNCSGARYAGLVTSPAMKALRRIEIVDTAVIRVLERVHAPIAHVACPLVTLRQTNRQFFDLLLSGCARIESIRSLACELEVVPEVMRSPIGSRLKTLTVSGEVAAALAFWRNFRAPIELVIAPHARLPRLSSVDVEGEGSIRARREDGRVILRVSGPFGLLAVRDHWNLLNADRIELVMPVGAPALAVIDELARGRVEIVRIPRERRAGIIQ